MGRLSTRSNPTNLREIPKNRVNISVGQNGDGRFFVLDRLDIEGLKLGGDLSVICIARAGRSSQRYELGMVSSWSHESQSLAGLDASEPLRFRIVLHEPGNPRLVASAERIRPMDDSQSESLLPMEPADLGERLWRLDLRDDGPVLLINMTVFPSAAGVENFPPFGSLVLPEALHKVLQYIAANPSCLDDDADEAWSGWSAWLEAMGAEKPPEDEAEQDQWCREAVANFCQRHRFASKLREDLRKGEGE